MQKLTNIKLILCTIPNQLSKKRCNTCKLFSAVSEHLLDFGIKIPI